MIAEAIAAYILDRRFVYQIAATLITISLIRTAIFIGQRKRRFQLRSYYGIPGPKPSLIDGNLHLYRGQKQYFKVDEELSSRYGKYYGVFIGDNLRLVITDPELLRKVFFERTSSFKERTVPFIESPISDGLLFARYNRWKTMRKIMSAAFSTYTMRGEASTQFIETSVKLMLDYIDDRAKNRDGKGYDSSIDIHELMKATALHMITNMAVPLPNVQVVENENNVKSLDSFLSSTDEGVVVFAIMMPFLKRILSFIAENFEYNATMALIHRGLNQRIDDELKCLSDKSGSPFLKQNLLHTLIKLLNEGKLTRREVIGCADTILFAGYDTTSTTLTYVFWVLGMQLAIQEKLRSELMAHGVDSKYLEQVINETMRLYPTVISFTTRLATETVELDNLTIPQGTTVVYNSWLLHKDPKLWPEPEKFDPERFRAGVEHHPCAFAPFGLGERRCLGYSLALLEMKMIICDVLTRYRLKTKAPKHLELISYANVLSKPLEKIFIDFEKL